MTVYVDDAVTLWRGHRWAHLMADTLDELHDFAARLGIPRRAFQDKTSGAHYDVTAQLRERAIALGAMPISRHAARALMRRVIAMGRAHVWTPVTNAQLVCRLHLEKKKKVTHEDYQ